MKRKMQVLSNACEVIEYYMPGTDFALQENRLSYFDHMRAICHWHDDLELIHVLQGQMNFYVNGRVYLIKEGDGLIVNSKQMHYGYDEEGGDCFFYCILVHPRIYAPESDIYQNFVQPIIHNNAIDCLYLNKDTSSGKALIDCIDRLMKVYKDNGVAKEVSCTAILYQLWAQYYRCIASKYNLHEIQIDNNLLIQQKMINFIYENYGSTITLDDIAASGNVCRSKCCHLFRHYTQKTPMAFLNSYRLDMSSRLLNQTDRTITDISISCGFNHLSYFEKIFCQHYGCSPRQYRIRNQ